MGNHDSGRVGHVVCRWINEEMKKLSSRTTWSSSFSEISPAFIGVTQTGRGIFGILMITDKSRRAHDSVSGTIVTEIDLQFNKKINFDILLC